MSPRKLLKSLHVTGTAWLAVCAAFLLIVALRQAGVGWWVVFSLSGYSGVAFFLLLSIYLFAIFRGVTRKQMSREHPLTTSPAYILFYDLCPFLGTLAGLFSAYAFSTTTFFETSSIVVEGTLAMTFLVWIFCDPLISLAEGALPSSVASRRERIAEEKERKQIQQAEREAIWEKIRCFDQNAKTQWNQELLPLARDLAVQAHTAWSHQEIRQKALAYGARAWQLGGIACMRHLMQLVRQQIDTPQSPLAVHLPFWWDGIGKWRKPALKEVFSNR